MNKLYGLALVTTLMGLILANSLAYAGWNDDQKNRWRGDAQRNCTQKGDCP